MIFQPATCPKFIDLIYPWHQLAVSMVTSFAELLVGSVQVMCKEPSLKWERKTVCCCTKRFAVNEFL